MAVRTSKAFQLPTADTTPADPVDQGLTNSVNAYDANDATAASGASVSDEEVFSGRRFQITTPPGQNAYLGIEIDWAATNNANGKPFNYAIKNPHSTGSETLKSGGATFARVTEQFFFAPAKRYTEAEIPKVDIYATIGDVPALGAPGGSMSVFEVRFITVPRGDVVTQEG